MADTDNLRTLRGMSETIFKKRSVPSPAVMQSLDAALAAPQAEQVFSEFVPSHQQEAISLAGQLMQIATDVGGDEGLRKALEAADQASETNNLDLVKYALMVFITHFPQANKLRIPSLVEREPHKVASSMAATGAADALEAQPGLEAATLSETVLNWFREDPLVNEHHERWHVVYPASGVPVPSPDPTKQLVWIRARHGELFLYMHEQMLARYDTERLTAGLGQVVPFDDYRQVITEGYDPGPQLAPYYSPRPDGTTWTDMTYPPFLTKKPPPGNVYPISDHEARRDLIQTVAETGSFSGSAEPVDPSSLCNTIESNIGSQSATPAPAQPNQPAQVSPPALTSTYGQLHNWGHLFFSLAGDPTGKTPPGVMSDTATAVRDYVFFRWHRHVDDFSFTWQETQPPNDFSDAPDVLIRKSLDGSGASTPDQSPDIILCYASQIPAFFNPDGGINEDVVTQFGEQHFGGDNWDRSFFSGGVATDELLTYMYTRPYEYDSPDEQPPIKFQETVTYLDQEEFVYFIRVQNPEDQEKQVTARVFLALEEAAENRRLWIEMDKFVYTLGPGQRAVIGRPAAFSSVIRKPASKPPQFIPIQHEVPIDQDPQSDINWCDCGWPYNVLLPKGTPEGAAFRFFVMFTDWSLDQVKQDSSCGSMSYCGSKNDYPDKRVMGYPFDRPFANGSIAETFAPMQNVATRNITIRHGGDAPGGGTPLA